MTNSPITPRTFAIDYDGTFTADPVLWSQFVSIARKQGHRFFMVTARRDTSENIDQINTHLDEYGCPMCVICTSLASKIYTCEQRGIKIDIWIDDDPTTLVRGH